MKRYVFFAALACALASAAHAEQNDVALNFYLTLPQYSGCAVTIDEGVCSDLASTTMTGGAHLWVVASRENASFGGLQFGQTMNTEPDAWTLCTGGSEIPQNEFGGRWPEPGTGNAVTWAGGCYDSPGENARVGFFTLHDVADYTVATLTEDPRCDCAQFVDCSAQAQIVELLGALDLRVGGSPVCPCAAGGVAPQPATNCDATNDACEITVSWEHDGVAVAGFNVLRDGAVVKSVSGLERSAFIPDGPMTATYEVVAFNGCGEAPVSNPAEGVRFGFVDPPTEFTIGDACPPSMSWTPPSDTSTLVGYRIRRGSTVIADLDASVTTFVDVDPPPGFIEYSVQSIGTCVPSSLLSAIVATGADLPAPELDDIPCVPLSAHLSWSHVGWAQGYRVEVVFSTGPIVYETGVAPHLEIALPPELSGDSFSWRVATVAVCDDGEFGDPQVTEIDVELTAPVGLDIVGTDASNEFWQFSWQPVDGADSYELRLFDEACETLLALQTTSDTSVILDMRLYGAPDDLSFRGQVTPISCANTAGPPTACQPFNDGSLDDVVLNFYRTAPSYGGCDDPAFVAIDDGTCTDLVSEPSDGGFLWVVASAFDDAEFGGMQFGVEIDAPPSGWTLCTGGLEIPDGTWPASGSGNAVTWPDGCYMPPGSNARIGYFVLDDAGASTARLTPDPRIGVAQRTTCSFAERRLDTARLGSIRLGEGGASRCCPDVLASPTGLTAVPTEPGGSVWQFGWDVVPGVQRFKLAITSGACGRLTGPSEVRDVLGTSLALDMGEYGAPDDPMFVAWVSPVTCDGETGPRSDCVGPGGPVPVALQSLEAGWSSAGVRVEWRTGHEIDIVGFHLWRDVGSGFHRITSSPIAADGSGAYTHLDDDGEASATATYRLTELDRFGDEHVLGEVTPVSTVPATLALTGAPNPFNPRTSLTLHVPSAGRVSLSIYDASGRRVRALVEQRLDEGRHVVVWDGTTNAGSRVASGVYFARLVAGGDERRLRLTVLK